MSVPTELAKLLANQLELDGVTVDNLALIAENRIISRVAARSLNLLCEKVRATGFTSLGTEPIQREGSSYLRRAMDILGDVEHQYELRVFAAMLELNETKPHKEMSMAAVADVMRLSRQTVSRAIRMHRIDFQGLTKRLP